MGRLVSRAGLAAQPRSPSVTPTARAALPSTAAVPLARPVPHLTHRPPPPRQRPPPSTAHWPGPQPAAVYRRRPHVTYTRAPSYYYNIIIIVVVSGRCFFFFFFIRTVRTVVIFYFPHLVLQPCALRACSKCSARKYETTRSNAADNRNRFWYVVGARVIASLPFPRLTIFQFK